MIGEAIEDDVLHVQMLDKQMTFYDLTAKWAAGKGGVGSGKTMSMVWFMIERLEEYPQASHVVVGADYEQLRRGFYPSLVGVLEEDLGWERGVDFHYRESPTPMVRFLHNGARLRAMSAELAQRVRSAEFQTIYCEEPPTWHNGNGQDTFRAISGRLRHSRKSAVAYPDMPLLGRMTFNPPAIGTWLYDLIEKAWKEQDWPCLTFSLRDNILLPGLAEYVHQIETMYPPDRWPSEIDGEWSTLGGAVYRSFNHGVHTGVPPAGFPPVGLQPKELLWALDFNVGLQCSVVSQAIVQQPIIEYHGHPKPSSRLPIPGWQRRVFYAIDELAIPDAGIEDIIPEFIRRYGDHGRKYGVRIYGDASGGARSQLLSSQSSVRTNWRFIKDAFRKAKIAVTWCVPEANPSEGDRVNCVNAQFIHGDGFGVLVDSEKCPTLVKDFFAVRYKDGTNQIEKKTTPPEAARLTHMSDAWGYMIYNERMRLAGGKFNPAAWSMER